MNDVLIDKLIIFANVLFCVLNSGPALRSTLSHQARSQSYSTGLRKTTPSVRLTALVTKNSYLRLAMVYKPLLIIEQVKYYYKL